jgi:hypothetical protein
VRRNLKRRRNENSMAQMSRFFLKNSFETLAVDDGNSRTNWSYDPIKAYDDFRNLISFYGEFNCYFPFPSWFSDIFREKLIVLTF